MVSTLQINADHGRDFHYFADHMTKLQHLSKCEVREFSAFLFSLHLMFDQTFSNIIICLMISQENYIHKLNKRPKMTPSQLI